MNPRPGTAGGPRRNPGSSRLGGPGGSRASHSGEDRRGRGRSGQGRPGAGRAGSTGRTEPGALHSFFHDGRAADQRGRLAVLLCLMLIAMAVLAGRALQLQAIEAPTYARSAASRMRYTYDLLPTRGQITDRNGTVLAQSESAVLVFVDPRMISRNGVDERVTMTQHQQQVAAAAPKAVAKILAKYLGGQPEDYRDAVTKKGSDGQYTRYSVVKRHVPSYTFDQISAAMKAEKLYGVFSTNDPVRNYPAGTVASNVVGFVNADGQGAGGLEYTLDKQLTGTKGKESYEASTYGRIPLGQNTLVPAVNGTSYTLTLDSQLQLMVQNALSSAVNSSKAESGEAIVMNVKTGEVLAMASTPTFDSNDLAKATANQLRNRAVSDAYEPGSVEKVLTMAALADKGLVTPDTHVVVPASLASGGGRITDAFDHGTLYLTARGVIANSSNIGTSLLVRNLDKADLVSYLKKFGLGARTGIGLPGEASGYLPDASMADYTRDQISFGQGLSVTAIQEAAAVAAIVNGGVYHSPTILKSAVDGNGHAVAVPRSTTRRVISAKASAAVLDMMESVVTLTADRAVPGYRTAGKTGTAQRVDPTCHCYRGYTASYINVGPVENPQILTYVVLNNPTKGGHQGSEVALPVVRQIMSVALPRYGVEPSTTPARKEPLEYTP